MPETAAPSTELWIPGQPLELPFEVPTIEAFRMRFVNQVWNGYGEPSTVNLDDCLSALRMPEAIPTAIACIDMDDLLANLGYSLWLLHSQPNGKQIFMHDYGYDNFYTNDDDWIKQPLMRLVKNHEQPGVGVHPVENIDDLASMIRSWRSAGVYIACITSAVRGAELPAVDFLGKYFNGAFDGIVATSSSYKTADKGKAAGQIVDFLGVAPGTPVIHIDDMSHNTTRVRTALQEHPSKLQVATFQHVFDHPSHSGTDPHSQHGATPLETFALANDYLAEKLGGTLHIPLPHFLRELRALAERQDAPTSVS